MNLYWLGLPTLLQLTNGTNFFRCLNLKPYLKPPITLREYFFISAFVLLVKTDKL